MKLKKRLLAVCSVLCLGVAGTALSGCSFLEAFMSGNGSMGDAIGGGGSVSDDGAGDVVGTEGVKYWIPEGENYAIAYGYAGEEKNIVIASEYDGMPVTAIDPYTYYMNHEDEMKELQDKVGQDQFFGFWDEILNVVIPDSVTSIGSSAFRECSSLTSVLIPDSVTSIRYGAFYECSSLTSVVIPDNVTSIGDEAFMGCSSLTSVVIPDSLTTIGDNAFYECRNLTDIYITDIAAWCGIDGVGWLMTGTSNNKKLYLNSKLVTELIIPDSVTSIGASVFAGCNSLTSVVIPDSVTSIGEGAFAVCSSLTSIEVGDSVTSIGWIAFAGCSSLASVVIPDSVTSIEQNAFGGCSSLTIYCEAESQPSDWDKEWNPDNRPVEWGYKGE